MGRELTTSSTGTAETSNGSFDAVLGNGLVGGEEHGNIVLEVSNGNGLVAGGAIEVGNGHGLVARSAVEVGNGHGLVAGGGLSAIGDGEGVVDGSGGKRTIGSTSGVLRNNTGFVSI